ncbi:alpha-L-arabinofuranosidase C-terminal domain-containing protein [Aestuariibaculum lutulentum]|uniref:non-reducing end alpha-L-arabinofuranosidase n=1 Tax=Aestuariibaculum lutulentum TaxID=2920935 RepID=A0ABS9RH54_9FLAO|nr:alpha-L-arabinofuranosidase C-terminal domain-containing protein [Aestuariibaculum lutulentum]MCH4552276.1 alpha-L-arabinofuranosidase [Aestuariibaculum lutulentum]
MIQQRLTKAIGLSLMLNAFLVVGQTDLEVDINNKIAEIQPTMYGVFFEDINFAADGGLYAEMIKNRSFEFTVDPFLGWVQPNSDKHSFNKNSGIGSIVKYADNPGNTNFIRVKVNNDQGYQLINEGFRGMGIKEGESYNLYLSAAKHSGNISKINVQFIDENNVVLGETSVDITSSDWTDYKAQITASKTQAKAKLKFTFEGTGEIDLDMISLFPVDTWKGREKGLRKDLVQLLYDLDPGFLRFPGGCIVEGRTLARRYQWKKTVGPIENREVLVNRWNTEFSHRLTPDYYQSFGLGFFEYFQLSEDLGAEPLPILSCGMACQFNSGELVPMDELDPYVQDAIELIEFANGSINTPWGKLRNEMGHPEPFRLKYIGVGNEQWGPDYIERYKAFAQAIKAKYPDMIIVSGSGPFPDGDYFEYGMEELKKLNAEIIDEHYYRSPEWFRENATRYDSYDRKGPKIFAGEYAAQSVAIASPENRNNWECAFSEAAFITGLERNAEVVNLTSYAPLMAHEEGWQWTPDMIWFNNLQSYGTANYQVQKLFSTNRGTDLISVTSDGQDLTGQNELYASAVTDSGTNEVIVKVVNTSKQSQEVTINLKGKKVYKKGALIVLKSENLEDENSFENPDNIVPVSAEIQNKNGILNLKLQPYSVSVIKFKLR